jgi:hypothetical protein
MTMQGEEVQTNQAVELWVLEAAATWAVRRALESGYHQATGRPLPTARDRAAPFRQVLLWAAVTAAAIAAADVIVDQLVLRPRQTKDNSPPG